MVAQQQHQQHLQKTYAKTVLAAFVMPAVPLMGNSNSNNLIRSSNGKEVVEKEEKSEVVAKAEEKKSEQKGTWRRGVVFNMDIPCDEFF